MKTVRTLAWIALMAAVARPAATAADHRDIAPAIYDEHADGARQVAVALAAARKEHKRVLLQFGANWCIWCHRLHDLLHADKTLHAELDKDYVYVPVDVDEDHNRATDLKYGDPRSLGIPALVVLDANGKQLTTKDSSELEEGDHHDPQKVMAFLKQWAPKN